MKIFSVRSKKLFRIVRILVFGLKMIGLAPFAVSVETSARLVDYQNTRIRAFRFSKMGLAYNLLLSILAVVLAAVKLLPQFGLQMHRYIARDNIERVTDILEQVLMFLSACVILASFGFRQDKAASITNRLLEVDAKLSVLKEQPVDKWTLIFLILHVTLNGYLWTNFWRYSLCYTNLQGFLESLCYFFPNLIVYWFIIEYSTVVGLVARELRTVNEYLLNIEELGNYLPRPPVRSHRLAGEIFLISDSNKLASLRLLRRVRTTLFELSEDIAGFCSLPILFSIASSLVALLGRVWMLFRIREKQSKDISFAENATLISAFILSLIYPVMSLALNVTSTATEAGQTGHIVHKLLAVARKRSEIRQELKEFSLQLLHERVSFTACGFVSLDATFMQTVLGGTMTYFIVLVQFHSASDSKPARITP